MGDIRNRCHCSTEKMRNGSMEGVIGVMILGERTRREERKKEA